MLQRQILSSNTALPKGEMPGDVWVKLSLHSRLYFSLPFLHTSPCSVLVLNLPISFFLLCPVLKWDLVVYLHMYFYLLTLRLCPVLKVSRISGILLVYQGIKTNGSSILSSRISVFARGEYWTNKSTTTNKTMASYDLPENITVKREGGGGGV